MSAEDRLEELGFELPPAPKAVGVYKPAITVGNLCHTSGHLPLMPDGSLLTGVVGKEATVEQGYDAARQAGLALLSTLGAHLGSINKIKRVVKIVGMVYCADNFTQQPAVINGCSELFAKVFGEDAGVGARSAVGVAALPLGVLVEIEGIFEIEV